MVLRGQMRIGARGKLVQCELVDRALGARLKLGPENSAACKLYMELAGVLGVGAVTVFVCKQTANDYLHDRLPFRFLRKIAVVAGDDCDRLVWRYWVMKPELLNRVFAQ